MDTKRNIGIIGAGGWGLALAKTFALRHQVTVWVYEAPELENLLQKRESAAFLPGVSFAPEIAFTGSLEEAARGKDLLILVTPSFAFRQTATNLKPFVGPKTVVVSATKGLEIGTLKTMSELARECLPKNTPVLTLSGPSHAEEVSRSVPTAVVVAGKKIALARTVRDMLNVPPYFRVYTSTDQKGVEFGGSLKNIIAIAAGVIDGLALGDNPKAALITRGLAEIVRFGAHHGAKAKTFYGLSGIGDLVVTCASTLSRNHRVGERLGKGENYEQIKASSRQVAEGVYAAKAIHEYAKKHKVDMPITESVYRLLFENASANEELRGLMGRGLKDE